MPHLTKKPGVHISGDRLRDVIVSTIDIHKPRVVFSLEESQHLSNCDNCIELFGNIVRQMIRQDDFGEG